MHDLEQRFHRAVGSLIGNESLIISLDENAAGELFAWAEAITRKIVQDTIGLDDEAAESRLAPRLRALRLMVRALARWVGEFHVLDEQARLSLW
ncbi:MAG TPA: hypothetical protein VNK49_04250, partial [Anaerolineales bacterium]|nr:hypothetical protein [Anaerolineales bacterium]